MPEVECWICDALCSAITEEDTPVPKYEGVKLIINRFVWFVFYRLF
jgi:hypothetical protein